VVFGSPDGESVRCERTLIFGSGRVSDQTWRGAIEYCKEFRRNK
jgi:hypothetical protein